MLGFDTDARVLRPPAVLAQADKLKRPDTMLFDRGAHGNDRQAIAGLFRLGPALKMDSKEQA